MIKCKVIETFTLGQFDKLKNIKRIGREEKGKLFTNDTFECDKEMADYLTGNNKLKRPFVQILEIIPEKIEEPVKKEKTPKEPVKKTTRKTTKKSIAKK